MKRIRNRFSIATCREVVAMKYELMSRAVKENAKRHDKPLTLDQREQCATWDVYAAKFRDEQRRHQLAGFTSGASFVVIR